MSPDLLEFVVWIVVIVIAVVLVIITYIVATSMVRSRSSQETSQDRRWTQQEIAALKRRLESLEIAAFGETRRQAVGMSTADFGRRSDGSHRETNAERGTHQDALEHEEFPVVAPIDARLEWEQFYEDAAAALQSASAFNAWAEPLHGKGYRIDASGSAPIAEPGSPDKADIYVIDRDNERLVLPGFGLRRAQGLLTSDSGRAAVERLGWLFDIVPGPELKATLPAFIEQGGWRVRSKGILSLPL